MNATIDAVASADKMRVMDAAYNMWQISLDIAHIAPYRNEFIDYRVKEIPALIAMLNPHVKVLFEARNVELHRYVNPTPVYLACCNHITSPYTMHIP